ncbi:uncharacterized protein N7484_008263 [Penicillium longicatenatum]|uniref:uncharacterized protein n=1 Tax=Penicillium longicatenatum TaxID=1561947 RepID=UPI0025482A38|nr:uncharacterized protein N7484_008263 [Penicillium longicatenatum]KAJ5634950.1 hypothetical protein N7484_008263 [Penicillium longicatenatum]
MSTSDDNNLSERFRPCNAVLREECECYADGLGPFESYVIRLVGDTPHFGGACGNYGWGGSTSRYNFKIEMPDFVVNAIQAVNPKSARLSKHRTPSKSESPAKQKKRARVKAEASDDSARSKRRRKGAATAKGSSKSTSKEERRAKKLPKGPDYPKDIYNTVLTRDKLFK